ncbi:MAG: hypothetical protein L0J62_10470 [Corynebacterium casei]|uniref:hypothetical protein n=1 Tax=Corynebacterium casei TaxID=160386 RepID=UPI00264A2816|nr:hypothetical protein [Corynebacterium casei]MDN6286098.1 hypothetical protein [Corynebacterium casei]
MTNANDVRRAHEILDDISIGHKPNEGNLNHLRSFLPDLPKQKTLEELRREVYDVWAGTNGNEWPDDVHGDLETWLAELHAQLQGLKDTPATVPALPAGMRIADHEEYGRVVVSPNTLYDAYKIFHLDSEQISGADLAFVTPDTLTFIDAEPAKSTPPEFLETEADYQNAPEGTIVARDGTGTVWMKNSKSWARWASTDGDYAVSCPDLSVGRRRVLRWGK